MRVSKAESALGRSNYEKICKFIDGNEIDCLPVNHQLYDVFNKLESGYNFNDSITDIIILQAETIKTLQKQCIDNAIMKTSQSVFVNK
jgi:hypothetical protein